MSFVGATLTNNKRLHPEGECPHNMCEPLIAGLVDNDHNVFFFFRHFFALAFPVASSFLSLHSVDSSTKWTLPIECVRVSKANSIVLLLWCPVPRFFPLCCFSCPFSILCRVPQIFLLCQNIIINSVRVCQYFFIITARTRKNGRGPSQALKGREKERVKY